MWPEIRAAPYLKSNFLKVKTLLYIIYIHSPLLEDVTNSISRKSKFSFLQSNSLNLFHFLKYSNLIFSTSPFLDIPDSKDDLPRRWIPATFVSNSLALKLTHKPAINSPGRMKKRYHQDSIPNLDRFHRFKFTPKNPPRWSNDPPPSLYILDHLSSLLPRQSIFSRLAFQNTKIIIPIFNWPRSKNSNLA